MKKKIDLMTEEEIVKIINNVSHSHTEYMNGEYSKKIAHALLGHIAKPEPESKPPSNKIERLFRCPHCWIVFAPDNDYTITPVNCPLCKTKSLVEKIDNRTR